MIVPLPTNRYSPLECGHLASSKCYIFPRLDGVSVEVWWDDWKGLCFEADAPKCGFKEWLEGTNPQATLLRDFFSLEENRMLRVAGQWLVHSDVVSYEPDKLNRFWVTDVLSDDRLLEFDIYEPMVKHQDVVHPMGSYDSLTMSAVLRCMESNVYLVEEGRGLGFGVYIKNYEVDPSYWCVMGSPASTGGVEAELVRRCMSRTVSHSVVNHILAEISAEFGDEVGFDHEEVYARACTEFMDMVVKGRMLSVLFSMGLPTVDFAVLQKQLNKAAHEAVSERIDND